MAIEQDEFFVALKKAEEILVADLQGLNRPFEYLAAEIEKLKEREKKSDERCVERYRVVSEQGDEGIWGVFLLGLGIIGFLGLATIMTRVLDVLEPNGKGHSEPPIASVILAIQKAIHGVEASHTLTYLGILLLIGGLGSAAISHSRARSAFALVGLGAVLMVLPYYDLSIGGFNHTAFEGMAIAGLVASPTALWSRRQTVVATLERCRRQPWLAGLPLAIMAILVLVAAILIDPPSRAIAVLILGLSSVAGFLSGVLVYDGSTTLGRLFDLAIAEAKHWKDCKALEVMQKRHERSLAERDRWRQKINADLRRLRLAMAVARAAVEARP